MIRKWLRVLVAAAAVLLAPAAGAADGQNRIESFNVTQQGGEVLMKLTFREPLAAPPVGFAVANPARIALDLQGVANGLGRNSQVLNEGDLLSVNLVETPAKTRLVLNLNQSMTYQTRLDGNALFVSLKPVVRGAAAVSQTRFAEERPTEVRHAVRDINFRRGKDGEGRVVVDLSDPGVGIDIRQQGSVLLVDIQKATLPESLRTRFDVADFATPVTAVTAAQKGDNVQLTISPRGLWEHSAYQAENQFVVEVKQIVENPNKLVQGSKLGYQGPKVSISYHNGDVRQLLRVMAEELGLNAVISETVTGTTTLVLKDVPADQVLDIIFQQKGLDMRRNGNVILIAPRDEIATREKLDLEAKQQIGDLEAVTQESYQLNYAKAPDVLKLLTDHLSKKGKASYDPRTNILFVSDTPSRQEEVRRLISTVDRPVRQVMIEAKIVEASDSFNRSLGARLGFGTQQRLPGGPNIITGGNLNQTAYFANQVTTQPTLGKDFNVNLPASTIGGSAAGALSFVLYNSNASRFLDLEISALEADGRGKIVSSPRVVTANQVEALIEQGVEIPYQQATSSGATSVSFRKANLSLKVKPQITPDGRITLSVDVNKDTPNTTISTGAGVAIDTKHVKTEVLVENGGTVVIGGIYQQNLQSSTTRIPFFGDLPLIGFLFRHEDKQDNKTELLVFITPKIISESLTLR
ncbi:MULTISPECIES: type IV pilus secretin family protein [Betaproteobacteria]|uniref:type IV pilus secretin family protein n=1 Tax=Betaproteobacteria TaxID=28216 RepID=UPI0025BDA07A|nr:MULTISPECIES: type IV pilus secretin family protein [Betaproteobacteria]MCE1193364.1 type IV pilus secretin PilQ [Acidovorax sp.]MCE1243202.1 type IV pilus secretin PilQ [Oryzomicrobium sp.]